LQRVEGIVEYLLKSVNGEDGGEEERVVVESGEGRGEEERRWKR